MKNARDPALALPGELLLARPVAAQADLDVARRVDDALPRRAGTSACRARRSTPKTSVPVSVWVSKWTRPTGAVRCRAGADVRLGDRVVAAEHDRHRAGRDDLADGALDRRVRLAPGRPGSPARRRSRRPQHLRRVDPGLEVRPGRAARGADRARAEARARAVGDEVVGRRADDRDVDARRARPGPACRAGRRRSAGPRSRASRRGRASARADRSRRARRAAARARRGRSRARRPRSSARARSARRTGRAAAARRTPRSPSRAADSRSRFPSRAPRARRRTRPGRARGSRSPSTLTSTVPASTT